MPQFVDCWGQVMVLELNSEQVSARLPKGYVLVGLTDAFADVNLEVLHCQAVILDNETVLSNVGFAWTLAFVEAPPGLDAPDKVDVYILEFVTDNDQLAMRLRNVGLLVERGSVDLTNDTGQVLAKVDAQGKWSYDATAAVSDGEERAADNLQRKHHFGETPTSSFWENSTYYGVGQYIKAVQVTATGGVLKEASLASAGHVNGMSDAAYFSGQFEFQVNP